MYGRSWKLGRQDYRKHVGVSAPSREFRLAESEKEARRAEVGAWFVWGWCQAFDDARI